MAVYFLVSGQKVLHSTGRFSLRGSMGKNPAFQFYPNDWLGDNQLQMTSTSTKGIWIQFLCRMWWAEDKGTVSGTRQQLCQLSGCNPAELEIFLAENTLLNFAGVTEHDKIVTVVNRRMQREEQARKSNTSRQARFRNAHSNATVTPPSPSPSTPTPSTPSPIPTPKKKNKEQLPTPRALPESAEWPSPLALFLKYNREATDNCPAITSVSPGRMKKASEYLAMFPEESWWTRTFRQYHLSGFLNGTEERGNGHKGFQPDFDWLLSKGKTDGIENCVKVHDGRYSDAKG